MDGPGDCWLWTAANDGYLGYGRFHFAGAKIGAHRFSYLLHRGEIPEGWVVDHLCRVANCVNPDHLEAVTQAENVSRGLVPVRNAERASAITRCPENHPYAGGNLYVTSADKRQCKLCKAAALRRWRERFRANREAS